jgi:hypothetical protein
MPVSKIISIPYMAQAMMAITLLKPDSARARPSTLINSEKEYQKLFSLDTPIDVYLKAVQIMKKVENYLKPDICEIDLQRKDITNIKFYVAMLVSIKIIGGTEDIVKKLNLIPTIEIEDSDLSEALLTTLNKFLELGGIDQIAKGPTLLEKLLENLG